MKFTIEQIKAAPKSEKRSRFSEVYPGHKEFWSFGVYGFHSRGGIDCSEIGIKGRKMDLNVMTCIILIQKAMRFC